MLIQVGELAKRAGLTVRTLHHYEPDGAVNAFGQKRGGLSAL